MKILTDPGTPLLQLAPNDAYRLSDLFAGGLFCCGASGSGKTSSIGAALKRLIARSGAGACILVAKPDEADSWKQILREEGQLDRLIEFTPDQGEINVFSYLLALYGKDGISSVIEAILQMMEAARVASPFPGRPPEAFWTDSTRSVLRHALPIIHAATGTVTVADIVNFLRSAPQQPSDLADEQWRAGSFFWQTFKASAGRIDPQVGLQLGGFWADEWARMDGKLRTSIFAGLSTTLDRLNHSWLRRAFSGGTSIVPEMAFKGHLILLNMPALSLGEDGAIAQMIFKHLMQLSILNRPRLAPALQQRLAVIYADEAQEFVVAADATFLATSRSANGCTVYLTQSLPTLCSKLGEAGGRERAYHLLGNFGTKVFLANGCPETNEWASKCIGRRITLRSNYSQGHGTSVNSGGNSGMNWNEGTSRSWGTSNSSGTTGNQSSSSHGSNSGGGASEGQGGSRGGSWGHGSSANISHGYSEQSDWAIEPGDFARFLKTGGPANGGIVSAVWFQAGRTFHSSGTNYLITEFAQ